MTGSGLAPSECFDARRRVIDEDEIEIGGRRHLAAAELAHRDHGERAARQSRRRVAASSRSTTGKQSGDHAFGDIGEGGAGRVRLGRALDDLHADAEDLLLGEAARGIERGFVVARRVRAARASVASSASRDGSSRRNPGSISASSVAGRARQMLGQPRRRAGDLRDQLQQIRIARATARTAARRPADCETKRSNCAKAASGSAVAASASSSAGTAWSAVRAPARCAWRGCGRDASRGSRRRHARHRETPCAASVASVSGSSSTPVKTRLPSGAVSGGSRSNSRA